MVSEVVGLLHTKSCAPLHESNFAKKAAPKSGLSMNSINCIDEACYFLLLNAAKPRDPRHLALILSRDLFDKSATVHLTLNVLTGAMRFGASFHLQWILSFRTCEKTQGQFLKIADPPA